VRTTTAKSSTRVSVIITRRAGRKRAKQQTGKDVAEQDGLAKTPSDEAAKKGCGEDHGNIAKNKGMWGHSATS
jgi:hypothetical protein